MNKQSLESPKRDPLTSAPGAKRPVMVAPLDAGARHLAVGVLRVVRVDVAGAAAAVRNGRLWRGSGSGCHCSSSSGKLWRDETRVAGTVYGSFRRCAPMCLSHPFRGRQTGEEKENKRRETCWMIQMLRGREKEE